jgi:hypothetical protein
MTLLAVPAHALTYGGSPGLICANNTQGAEVVAREMSLQPASGAIVPAGTPVTFSGESSHALTFSVASSPALLATPDIDSGAGSQSGSSYGFTSAKATATPRTIYWTASFTFTPNECETPSTFTTPVRTLIVAPTAAELEAAMRQQEAEASEKQAAEEAAVKKKAEEVAAAGRVILDGLTVDVVRSHYAVLKLTCSDVATCAGRLTLTGKSTTEKGDKTRTKATTIGTATFSIQAGEAATVKLTLNPAGKTLLSVGHGHLNATLTILKSSPAPSQTLTENVQLALEKAHGKAKK